MTWRATRWHLLGDRRGWLMAAAIAIVGCTAPGRAFGAEDPMQVARDAAARAERATGKRQATREWLRCAGNAWRAMQAAPDDAARLSTRCTDELRARAFAQRAHGWKAGATRV